MVSTGHGAREHGPREHEHAAGEITAIAVSAVGSGGNQGDGVSLGSLPRRLTSRGDYWRQSLCHRQGLTGTCCSLGPMPAHRQRRKHASYLGTEKYRRERHPKYTKLTVSKANTSVKYCLHTTQAGTCTSATGPTSMIPKRKHAVGNMAVAVGAVVVTTALAS